MGLILGAAHELFAERGYAAVTMEEIAAEIGVTKPLLYRYFGNKERLYIACMEEAGDTLLETIAAAIGETASPEEATAAGIQAFFAFIDGERAAWAVLFDETQPHAGLVAERVAVYRSRLLGLVSDALMAQFPAPRREGVRVEVEALSTALLGAAESLARWWLGSGEISAAAAAELLVSTVAPGIRARSNPPRPAHPDREGPSPA